MSDSDFLRGLVALNNMVCGPPEEDADEIERLRAEIERQAAVIEAAYREGYEEGYSHGCGDGQSYCAGGPSRERDIDGSWLYSDAKRALYAERSNNTWECGCGHVNGPDLDRCAACNRRPGEER